MTWDTLPTRLNDPDTELPDMTCVDDEEYVDCGTDLDVLRATYRAGDEYDFDTMSVVHGSTVSMTGFGVATPPGPTYRGMFAEWRKGCSCGTWTRNCFGCNVAFFRAVLKKALGLLPEQDGGGGTGPY